MKAAKANFVWAMPCMGLVLHSESYKVTGETFLAHITTQKVRTFLSEKESGEMRERQSSEER